LIFRICRSLHVTDTAPWKVSIIDRLPSETTTTIRTIETKHHTAFTQEIVPHRSDTLITEMHWLDRARAVAYTALRNVTPYTCGTSFVRFVLVRRCCSFVRSFV
jgi:hypothetical protein